ncbi:MAG: hypothetical protein WKF85_15310, partial [Chitinophagaceae bacterium]
MEQRDLLSNDLVISSISQSNLLSSAKWAKFLAIVGFIFIAIMVLGGLFAQTLMSSYSSSASLAYSGDLIKYMGIVYVVFAVILFFPCLYLFKFSNKMQEAVRTSSQESVDTAFINLKSMFKFYGI